MKFHAIHFDLSRGQAKIGKILSFRGPNDLEDVGQGHPYSIGVFCANLVKYHPILFDLWGRQGQNGPISSVLWPNDLEDVGQGHPY